MLIDETLDSRHYSGRIANRYWIR